MKKIKLEVLVETRDAWDTFESFKNVKLGGITEYTLSIEDVKEHDG